MPRFMMMMFPGPDAEKGVLPDAKILAEMGKFNEELVNSGVLLAGEGLHPSSKGVRVRYSTGAPVVQDGPFAEAKEVIGGFWIIQAKSLHEATAWAQKVPARNGEMVEIRQVFSPDDFAPVDPTGELRASEDELRRRAAANNSKT
ncbi:MAG TPA: YciI family protein [Myxococcota bacterium]|jgi:hypothetical protein